MPLGDDLIRRISKKFGSSETISLRYRNYDVVLKTDADGNAKQMFIGKADANGNITGDRYIRVLKHDQEGNIIKDHWDRKGRAS